MGFGIRDVEVLRAVVERDGFRAAAEALGLSQSAVSNRVAALERALGVALFDRTHRKAALTPEGRRFLEEAGRLVALRDRIMAGYGGGGEAPGTLRLGVAETVVHTRLPRLMRALRDAAPGLRIELAVESSPTLADRLAGRRVDVAVLMRQFVPPGATARPLGRFELGWYARAGDAAGIAGSGPVTDPAALARHPIVTFAHGTLPHAEVERLLSDPREARPVLHGSASLATMMAMVADGLGVGTLPRALAAPAVARGRIAEIPAAASLRLTPLEFAACWLGAAGPGLARALDEIGTDLSGDRLEGSIIR